MPVVTDIAEALKGEELPLSETPETSEGDVEETTISEDKTEPEKAEKTEPPKAETKDKPDPEIETIKKNPKIMSFVDSEVDKRLQSVHETARSNSDLITKQKDEIRKLNRALNTKESTKRLSSLLAAYDEEGQPAENKPAFEQSIKEILAKTSEYDEKVADVEEALIFAEGITSSLKKEAIKEYGLDSPNPGVRLKNTQAFITMTASVYGQNQNFLLAVEQFFPKGAELRQQLDGIIEGMAEFEGENAKKLYLADRMKGLKLTPGRKPSMPSGEPGDKGTKSSKVTIEDKLANALEKSERR